MKFDRYIAGSNVLLFNLGALMLLCFIAFALLSTFDNTQILGINRWIKPMKFAASITIYVWTIAFYIHLALWTKTRKIIAACLIAVFMVGEMFLITMQSARGTTSHFNTTTSFDGAVYAIMGALIIANTALIVILTIHYMRAHFTFNHGVLFGMRFGLVIFLFGSLIGGIMTYMMRHSIGVPDGDAGLPFLNWSLNGGDLRPAHFLGLHALQIIPLVTLAFDPITKRHSEWIAGIFGFGYGIFTGLLFIQALMGEPISKSLSQLF